jgi:pyruvate kinase
MLTKMIENGMNVARINMSHGDHEMHREIMRLARGAARDLGKPLAIMCDTKGPGIRTGELQASKAVLEHGQELILTEEMIEGNNERISVDFKGLHKYLKKGNKIWLNDGEIELEVIDFRGEDTVCTVHNPGVLGARKGVNLPGIDLPGFDIKVDEADIKFASEAGADYIAASFVRTADDVKFVRSLLKDSETKIVAKIETRQAVENIDDILPLTDALMVARGDLGVEIPVERVPLVQKSLVRKCNELGKPVIIATQMLKSMVDERRPTRAEAADVANAILDGTDAIMLSEETAIGDHPHFVVDTMRRIALEAESSDLVYHQVTLRGSTQGAISASACKIAESIGAQAIIPTTSSGSTAFMVARFRPRLPIIAVTYSERVRNQLAMVWGVNALLTEFADHGDSDKMVRHSVDVALEAGLINKGDKVVITAGVPFGVSGTTNLINVDEA